MSIVFLYGSTVLCLAPSTPRDPYYPVIYYLFLLSSLVGSQSDDMMLYFPTGTGHTVSTYRASNSSSCHLAPRTC